MSINLLNNEAEMEYVNYSGESVSENEENQVVDYSAMEETVYKKAVRWLLLVGAFMVPLFFLPWTTSVLELNKQLLLVVVAGVGMVLWLLDVVMSGRLSWRPNPIDNGVIGILSAVVLSSVFSPTIYKSVFGMAGSLSDSLLSVASLAVIYLLVVHSFDDRGKYLRTLFSVSVIVAILFGILQIFGFYIFSLLKSLNIPLFNFTLSAGFNTLGSLNVIGMMSAFLLPVFYCSDIRMKISKYGLSLSKIGVIVSLVMLVIINWWVIWAVAIAGMVSVIAFESLNRGFSGGSGERRFKISKFLFPMTVMVLGIFLIVVNLNFVFIKNKVPVEVGLSPKLSANIAWKTLQNNWAFGYGPENFSLAFDKYGAGELRNSTLSSLKLFDSNSYALDTVANSGLIGLAALVFALWLVAQTLFRTVRTSASFSSETVGTISSLIAVIVAMFLYPFNLSLAFASYLILALFALVNWGDKKKIYNIEEKASLSLVSSLGFIGGLILVLVCSYFVSLNYVADVKYAKALRETKIENALDDSVKAINWNRNDDRFYRLSSQLAMAMLSKELNNQATKNDPQRNSRIQNYLSSAVTLAQQATQISPEESNNWSNLGNVYQNLVQLVDGADSLAEAAYMKASELRPGDPNFYNRIGGMYLAKSDLLIQLSLSAGASSQQLRQQASASLLKAEDALKKSIEMSNNFGLAIYNLGTVYERQGKLNEAIKQLEIVAPFNTDQPGLAFELGLLYYRANRKDNALAQLQRALVLSPDYANARWYLALLYEERKQVDLAIEQLEKILAVPANKDNEVIMQKLESLKKGKVSIPPGKVLDQKPL